MGFLDFLKDTIAIDPGTQNLRIVKEGDVVFNEQSQISFDTTQNVVSGIGDSAKATANDKIIKPINYTIADFQAFEMLLRSALKKSENAQSLFPKSYKMFISIPTGASEVDMRAYRDSAEHTGAAEVFMVFQNCSSALGMNLFEKEHFILIDFSSSKIEMTVFANGLPISEGGIKLGTGKIFSLLKNYLRRKYKIDIPEKELESNLASLTTSESLDEIKIQSNRIKIKEIQDLLNGYFVLVNDAFLETIERVSSHTDIGKAIANGVYFTGGGSAIEFLRNQIKLDSRINIHVSQNPFSDNTNGLKKIIAEMQKNKKYLIT